LKIFKAMNFLKKIRNFDLFALGHSAILYYLLIFYLAPVLAFLNSSFEFRDNDYKDFLYLTLGLTFLIFGYFNGLPAKIIKKLPNFLKQEWNFSKIPWVFGAVFILSLISKIVRILEGGYFHLNQNLVFMKSSFYSAVMMLRWLDYIALIIAFASYFYLKKSADKRFRYWRVIAYGVLLFEIVYSLPTCSKLAVIVPILLYLIVRWYVFKPDYKVIGAAAVFIFLLFSFGSICRSPTVLNSSLVIQDNQINLPKAGDFAVKSVTNRTNQFILFNKTIELGRSFGYNKMVENFLVTLGPPRFIWKDKPLSLNARGNEFGKAIGLVGSDDSGTSVGPTLPGDLYMNFGIFGLTIGMFLFGFLWRMIYLYFIKESGKSLSGILFYSVFWIEIIRGIEDWTAPVYAGLVKLFLLLLIIHLFTYVKSGIFKNH